MTKVKVCGITNLEDALACYFNGADAIGFVFYKKSPRYINPKEASQISKILPKKIKRVGVFVDEKAQTVKKIAKFCNLDMVQLHGKESPEYARRLKNLKVIKAFKISKKEDIYGIDRYKTFAYLFDSFSKSKQGGTGNKFDWKILARTAKMEPVKLSDGGILTRPKKADGRGSMKPFIFVSGGLTSSNVNKAIKLLKPDWVDVSSSLESRPGKKDHKKIEQFIGSIK